MKQTADADDGRANGWQSMSPGDVQQDIEPGTEGMGEDGVGDEPVQVDHTAERHHNWKRGVQSLLDRLAASAGTARKRVTVAARIGAEALQKSRASHSTGQVDVISQQVEAIEA